MFHFLKGRVLKNLWTYFKTNTCLTTLLGSLSSCSLVLTYLGYLQDWDSKF